MSPRKTFLAYFAVIMLATMVFCGCDSKPTAPSSDRGGQIELMTANRSDGRVAGYANFLPSGASYIVRVFYRTNAGGEWHQLDQAAFISGSDTDHWVITGLPGNAVSVEAVLLPNSALDDELPNNFTREPHEFWGAGAIDWDSLTLPRL